MPQCKMKVNNKVNKEVNKELNKELDKELDEEAIETVRDSLYKHSEIAIQRIGERPGI